MLWLYEKWLRFWNASNEDWVIWTLMYLVLPYGVIGLLALLVKFA